MPFLSQQHVAPTYTEKREPLLSHEGSVSKTIFWLFIFRWDWNMLQLPSKNLKLVKRAFLRQQKLRLKCLCTQAADPAVLQLRENQVVRHQRLYHTSDLSSRAISAPLSSFEC